MRAMLQVRVAFEDPAEDQVPGRPVGEPGDLDEHDRPGDLVLAVVRYPAASVDVDYDAQLFAQVPKRLVDRFPKRGELAARRDRR